MTDEFYKEQKEQSRIKSLIVKKYFLFWLTIMDKKAPGDKLCYLDLFSGPGLYDDGSESTPIMVLKEAYSKKRMKEKLLCIFNDKSPKHIENLKENFKRKCPVNDLKYKPVFNCIEVCEELADIFEKIKMVPSFIFIDPYGYKGISLKLIKSLTKDWGCDALIFFNYNRINAGINNESVRDIMVKIFGSEEALKTLQEKLKVKTTKERENIIVNEFGKILKNETAEYVIPFRFLNDLGKRTSHYLIFVTKNKTAYNVMKEILWKMSSTIENGVGSFEYSPVDDPQLELLFNYSRPLDSLGEELIMTFAGRTMNVKDIFKEHNYGTPFIEANYKEALRRLEEDGLIVAKPPAEERKMQKGKRTMADKVIITFSKK